MRSELLLEWMSEIGEGTTGDLRQRVKWLARTFDLNPTDTEANLLLRDMSSLGHAEVDWDAARWAVAPAVVALLPASGGTAVLAGRHAPGLIERLDDEGLAVEVVPPPPSRRGVPPPAAVYLQSESIEELARVATACGVRFVGCAAREIAQRLAPLSLGPPAAPPAWDVPAEHLQVQGNYPFRPGLPPADGLCRVTVQGRKRYLYRRGAEYYRTDHAQGVLWAIADAGGSVIRWRTERKAPNEDIGTVFIDQGAALPPLHSRALVLCTGMTAQFSQNARTAIYRNVPWSIAHMVAGSIRQQISVIN